MLNCKSIVAPILLAALALCAGCGANKDEQIAADLNKKIAADTDLKTAGVSAQVKAGQVTLTGNVASSDLELKAVKLANDQPGVSKVNDQIKLQPMQAAAPPPDNSDPPQQSPVPQDTVPPDTVPPSTAPQNPPPQAAAAPPPPPQPVAVTIPSGTAVSLRMIDSVDSARNAVGQLFRASLNAPLRVRGGVVVPRGTDVTVRLDHARSARGIAGRSELELQLVRMRFRGREYELVSNTYTEVGKGRGSQSAKRVGVGAVAGTIIGAIAGGGKGAAIGAAVGGGGTATYQAVTRGPQVRIPSETQLNFTLQAPVTVTVTPK